MAVSEHIKAVIDNLPNDQLKEAAVAVLSRDGFHIGSNKILSQVMEMCRPATGMWQLNVKSKMLFCALPLRNGLPRSDWIMNMKMFDKVCLLYAVLGALLLSALYIRYGLNQYSFGALAVFAISGSFVGIGVREIQQRITE